MARPVRPTRQGGADALCGIYAILNFLRLKGLEKKVVANGGYDAFYWILRAAEKQQLLDSEHIWGGFWWYELESIFNHLAIYHQLDFRAASLFSFSKALKDPGLFAVVSAAAEEGGAVITEVSNGAHWVLATAAEHGVIKVSDSAHSKQIETIDRDRKKSFWKEGIVLLPSSSSYVAGA